MRDGIAHHMHERIAQRRQHVRVQAHLAAIGLESDRLAQRLGGISHGSRKRCKHRLCRDQPKPMRDVAHCDECAIDAFQQQAVQVPPVVGGAQALA